MKRKILMACCVWHEDYIRGLLRGINRRLQKSDVELHAFISYDTSNDTGLRKKEQEIFSLPDLQEYDGILIASNSEGNKDVMEQFIKKGLQYGKKILSIERKFEKFPQVPMAGVDNYSEFYRVVEHFITVHNCKTFNYVGGPKDNLENQQRYKAFCDCLSAHGLQVDEERVGFYTFLINDGRNAYQTLKKKGLHLPDAVICANDTMAIGYCNAAMEDGYHIPEDFRVSGFDNFMEGQLYCVSLTSVNRYWEQLGYDSLDRLLEFIEGTKEPEDFYSPGRLVLNESCGCAFEQRDVKADISYVYREKKQKDMLELAQRTSRLILCRCRNLADMQESLKWCPDGSDLDDLSFCLNRSLFVRDVKENKIGYDSEMIVVTREEQKELSRSMALNPKNLYPSEKKRMYLFSSLNFGADTYGYCVAAYNDKCIQYDRYRVFKEIVSVALESIKQKEELNRANQKLQQLYVQDPMTGLYNRFGYMNLAENYLREHNNEIFLIYADVDNLKMINDSYGHEMGDQAIIAVSRAIENEFGEEGICVRMGGDEFLVMIAGNNEQVIIEKEKAVLAYAKEYGQRKDLPFTAYASMGHISSAGSEENLDTLVRHADRKMYEVKQANKRRNAGKVTE